jgi:uncharacterized protein (TIGR03083 family)
MTTGTLASKDALGQHCRDQLADLRALAHELTESEWETPSLCAGWRVKDVYAHLLFGRLVGPLSALAGVVSHRGNIDSYVDERSRQISDEMEADELVATFDQETSRWPEHGIAGLESNKAKLADNLVHELDVRWPIGRRRDMPSARLGAALTASCKTNMWKNFKRIKDLRFEATDLDWSYGDGPVVTGPAENLMLAINGRAAGLDGLAGDGAGVEEFRRRVA